MLLQSARHVERPTFIPSSGTFYGTKALGLRFEKRVTQACTSLFGKAYVTHGPWFEYQHSARRDWCQPDILVFKREWNAIFVLECKLTDVSGAKEKLRQVYVPVVEKALDKPTWGIVVCRHLTMATDSRLVFDSLRDAMRAAVQASEEVFPIVHYLGKGCI